MTRSIRLPVSLDLGDHPSARIVAALQIVSDDTVLRGMLAEVEARLVAGQVRGRPKGSRSASRPKARCAVCGRAWSTCGSADSLVVRRHPNALKTSDCAGSRLPGAALLD